MVGTVLTTSKQNDLCQSFIECGDKFIECGDKFRKKITSGVQAFFRHVTLIKDDTDKMSHLWKAVPAAMIALSNTDSGLIHSPAGRAVVFLEGVQLFGDFADILSGKLFKESWDNLAQRIAFIFANLGTTLLWVHELGFATLGSKLLGSFTMIGNGGAVVGYMIGAGKAIHTLATFQDHDFKKQVTIKAVLDLISSTAGAALPIINLLGVTLGPVSIALLVITASGFGLLSFCYENHHEEAFNEPKHEGTGPWSHVSLFIGHSEGLEKISKLFCKLVEETSYLAFESLASDASSFIEFHEVLKLPQSINGLINKKDGKYIWEQSIWKVGDMVCKTGLGLVTAAIFSIKFGFLKLANLASATIGGISFLKISPLAMIFGFSSCTLIENSINLVREHFPDNSNKSKAKKARVNVDAKLSKWIRLSDELKAKKTQALTTSEKVEVERKKALAKIEVRKSVENHARKLSLNEAHAFKQIDVSDYAAMKVKRMEIRHDNACHRCNKYSLGILNDLGKSLGAGLKIGSLVAAATVVAAPAAPIISAVAEAFAVTGAFVGVYKYIYDKKLFNEKPEPAIALAAS